MLRMSPAAASPHPDRAKLSTIAIVFSRIGALSFGGGLIAWMHREAVETRKWLSDQEFLSGLAICQVLPGGNMVNMSLYLGIRLRGALGAIIAILGLVGLPILVVIAIATVYARFDTLRTLHLVLDGVAAAAVGMNIATGVKAARRDRRRRLRRGRHLPLADARRRRLHRPAQHLPRPPGPAEGARQNPGERAA
jgi:chromate transporter